jgi:hypothetical protein
MNIDCNDAWNDAVKDEAISALQGEAIMARAARAQAILVFVEGDSEEVALPRLFTDVLDMDAVGVKIANYNGHGNLRAALRLLKLALSHDRPIIVTHDNDRESVASVRKCEDQGLMGGLVYRFPIPSESVVTYSDGHVGGSFEEAFPVDVFLKVVFSDGILPQGVVAQQASFERQFNPRAPWLRQLRKFAVDLGFGDWLPDKPSVAEALAMACDELPPTFSRLVALIQEVRQKYPVVDPNDVKLPKVLGLTYFPKKESEDSNTANNK